MWAEAMTLAFNLSLSLDSNNLVRSVTNANGIRREAMNEKA
jgi:hypothetical protein